MEPIRTVEMGDTCFLIIGQHWICCMDIADINTHAGHDGGEVHIQTGTRAMLDEDPYIFSGNDAVLLRDYLESLTAYSR